MANSAAAFNNAICSLCFNGFDPIVEDLQVVSICGHVFHELCLQDWFGYDSSKKRRGCPVCKQGCSENGVARLYFQWASAADSITGQKPVTDSDALHQELCVCKEQAKREFELKNEALKQQASMQQVLHMKSQEFEELNVEFLRLQERNRALEKEHAAAKLVSDLGLDEEKVLKVATIGNGGKRRDTIDVLRKSLVISNRSYKELVAKYNLLEQKEARYCKRLEKAKRKRNKYKTRVQDLKIAVELKGNEFLRALEASKKSLGGVIQDGLNQTASDTKNGTSVHGLCNLVQPLGSVSGTYNPAANTSSADVVIIDDDDDEPIQPVLNVRKASPIPHPLPGPGDACFSGGLIGPDGTNMYLGGWCKRRHKNGSETKQDSICIS